MRGVCKTRAAAWRAMTGGGASRRLNMTSLEAVVFWKCYRPFCNRRQMTRHALHTTAAAANKYDSIKSTNSGSIYDYNVGIGILGRQGNIKAAWKLFAEMPERDKVSYASMLSVYLKHNELHNAERLYSVIPECMRSIVADSAMVDAYAKAGRINKAKEVFDKMPERNGFSWTSLISGYFRIGKVDEAVELFGRMPDSVKNAITWTNVVMGFARNGLVDEARVAFDRMPLKNVTAWTSMIKAYVENNLVDEAFSLFGVMPNRNLYSWNIMICGFLDENRINEAKELFDTMPWRNAISWTAMVTGLARNGAIELARKYFDQMPVKDVPAWNAMITCYSDEGRMVEAGELFNMMSERNIITWNLMIAGYSKVQNEDEAYGHFVMMLRNGITPNETSLISLLTSCIGIMGVQQAHGIIFCLGFEMVTPVTNSLITMYHRSGDIISAHNAFEALQAKDVVTWSAIIIAYSNHGHGIHALQAFARMLRLGHSPDEVTFVGVLSACSHAGFVRKGQMLFHSIKRGYGLEPTAEHYSCLVDILGRAGLVNEAVKVVGGMPPDKCDNAVLGALVGGCRLMGADGVGDHIGDQLLELEPASSGGYVSLANLYAVSGKWDKLSELRKKMKERQVRKVPGCSQIQVNGKNHLFLVDDRVHPEMKAIYEFLREILVTEMKDFGDEAANLTWTL